MTPDGDLRLHPLDYEANKNPSEALAALQRECPVSFQALGDEPAIALVTKYADVLHVLRECPQAGSRPGADAVVGNADDNMLRLVGSEHARVRSLSMVAVRPRAVMEATGYIDEVCRETAASLPADGKVELRTEYAAQVPPRILCRLLGVPEQDHQQFLEWTRLKLRALAEFSRGETRMRAEFIAAETAFKAYMAEQLALRRAPGAPDDALYRMVHVEDEGKRLSDHEVIVNAIFILNAGNTTTQNLLTNLIAEMARRPELYARIRADRSLLSPAIEESLRVMPPIMYSERILDEAITLSGVELEPGQRVVISSLAANRDPEVWGENAAEFDLDRAPAARHFAFSAGPHSCFGAALARKMAQHAMNALLDRYDAIELAPDYVWERIPFWSSNAATRLDVVVRSSGRADKAGPDA
jgi:cytochrome P450